MPNFGVDGMLSAEDIDRVAKQVASLSGIEGGEASPEGKQLFADNCASCHGDDGAGLIDVGGPSLNDQIWLYGGTLEAIRAQVNQPRHGVMPAWGDRLDPVTIKMLAAYVHSLGGGEEFIPEASAKAAPSSAPAELSGKDGRS